MGIGSFFKGKMDKHGGAVGLARHAVKKASGGADAVPASKPIPAEDLVAAFEDLPQGQDADGFTAVAPSSMLGEGDRSTFKVGDIPVACFRVDGQVYVIDDECAHENGPLGEGTLEGFVVTCSYHNWRYDVRTGDCLTDSERPLSCFSVKEADGYIWVGPKTREGSGARGGLHDDGLKIREI